MQCPACSHNSSTSDFGQPPRCPECGAFYEKALVARAKRNELAASLEVKRAQVARQQASAEAPSFRSKVKSFLSRDGGRNIVFGAGISFFALVGIALWSKPDRGPEAASTRPSLSAPIARAKASEPNEYALKLIGEKNILARLKDPDSARFRGQFIGVSGIPCGEVNSKNGFGGYTGHKRYMASGGGIALMEGDMDAGEFDKAWSKLCR